MVHFRAALKKSEAELNLSNGCGLLRAKHCFVRIGKFRFSSALSQIQDEIWSQSGTKEECLVVTEARRVSEGAAGVDAPSEFTLANATGFHWQTHVCE
jgi:hypothetical protein